MQQCRWCNGPRVPIVAPWSLGIYVQTGIPPEAWFICPYCDVAAEHQGTDRIPPILLKIMKKRESGS